MPSPFNWVCDWFDAVADGNDAPALVVVEEDGVVATSHTFARAARALATRSSAWLAGLGVRRGDSVIVMLGNQVELWESMLAIIKLGAVVMPTTTAVGPADLVDRIERGGARPSSSTPPTSASSTTCPATTRGSAWDRAPGASAAGTTLADGVRRRRLAGRAPGHRARRPAAALLHVRHDEPAQARSSTPRSPTPSATCRRCTGSALQPGDVHLNISSPGWAKHAWSCFFAPWIAEATIVVLQLRALRPGRPAAAAARARGHHVLRAADGVADAHQRRPVRRLRVAARGRSAPASRSTPRSSRRSSSPGA